MSRKLNKNHKTVVTLFLGLMIVTVSFAQRPPDPANGVFTDEIIEIALEKGADAAVESYKKRGKSVELVEQAVNSKGYDLMNEKKFKEATELFRLNTLVFPRSGNAFDSLAEAYLEAGKRDEAIANYKKSLQLDPENGNAKAVLKRLGVN